MNLNLIPTLTLSENYNIVESVHFDLTHLKALTVEQVCGAYIATLLAGLVLVRAGDKGTKRILKDTSGASLTRFSRGMSPLNLWGLVIRKPETPEVRDAIPAETLKALKKLNGRILQGTFRKIHHPISTSPNLAAWKDIAETVRILLVRLNMKNHKTTVVTNTLDKWTSMDNDDRGMALAYCFQMLMQYDPNSPLIGRLHQAASSNLLSSSDIVDGAGEDAVVHNQLKEDEGGGDAGGASTATASADIAPLPVKLFKGRPIQRVKRNFQPKSMRYRRKPKGASS